MKKIIFLILISIVAAISADAQISLYDKDTLAVNQVFRQRVKSATIMAANDFAADTTIKADRAYLLIYANQIISNPDGGWISSMSYQVITNPVINYNSPDNDILFAVAENYEKCAKAFSNVLPQAAVSDPDASLGIGTLLHGLSQATTTSGTLDAGNTTLGNTVLKKQP